MLKLGLIVLIMIFSASTNAESLDDPASETSLNTANVIGAAWQLKRLSESLEPGVDTRCYIAKFAAFKAESLPVSVKIVAQYQKTDSDAFAIKSVEQAMQTFERNQVQKIADECKSKNES
ncbi:MAG TPA: hypothetical protein ENI05_11345 [Porticoccus sp.]|nr:hypothetical protein [Porticoccus sp.]